MDAHSVSVGLVIFIIVAALLFDYTNGFHDAANSSGVALVEIYDLD